MFQLLQFSKSSSKRCSQLPLPGCSASLITRVSMSDDILYEVSPPSLGSNERSCEPSHTNWTRFKISFVKFYLINEPFLHFKEKERFLILSKRKCSVHFILSSSPKLWLLRLVLGFCLAICLKGVFYLFGLSCIDTRPTSMIMKLKLFGSRLFYSETNHNDEDMYFPHFTELLCCPW